MTNKYIFGSNILIVPNFTIEIILQQNTALFECQYINYNFYISYSLNCRILALERDTLYQLYFKLNYSLIPTKVYTKIYVTVK